jgi:TRAP-type uncharacterized transport system fused permease subunit
MPQGFNMEVLYCWIVLFLSVIPFAAGAMGYLYGHLTWLPRLILMTSGILLIFPNAMVDSIGVALLLSVAVPQYLRWRRSGLARS